MILNQILRELRIHAPFTLAGAATGIAILAVFQGMPDRLSYGTFYILHPLHVFLSALVTASVFKLHKCGRLSGRCFSGKCNFWILFIIGYAGSIGIATISDSLIPYAGEVLLNMPKRGIHIGFIEKWWLVNPLALAGIAVAYFKPTTKFPHFGHVLLSTWASLFHILMSTGQSLNLFSYLVILFFLFLAVWLPCCVSDIVFPLLFIREKNAISWLRADGENFLKTLGIKEGQGILDFGCGGGNYTIPAARVVGKKGKVYAVDKNGNALKKLLEKANAEGLKNIEIINTGGEINLPVEKESMDTVLLFDVLHSYYSNPESRGKILNEVYRVLNNKGRMLLFPKHMESENFIEEIRKEGFSYKGKVLKTLMHNKSYEENYIYIFQKKGIEKELME